MAQPRSQGNGPGNEVGIWQSVNPQNNRLSISTLRSRDDAVVRTLASRLMWKAPNSGPKAKCGRRLLSVLASAKPKSPNSNSARIEDPHENQIRLM